MWGANGANKVISGSKMARLLHFKLVNSFTQIMKALMDVLYEKCSMSNVTFLISLCKDFNSSAVGSASVTCRVSVLPKNKPQSFFKKRCTPSIPFVS